MKRTFQAVDDLDGELKYGLEREAAAAAAEQNFKVVAEERHGVETKVPLAAMGYKLGKACR